MKPPKILHLDAAFVDNAISLWRDGQLVAFPTETVYGLGADATQAQAVARIYSVKSRPQFNPLIVHVASAAIAQHYGQWNPIADALAAAFWPGPLTLVLKKKWHVTRDRWQEENHPSPVTNHLSPICDLVSAGGDTVAIRVPAHPIALQLLRAFGGGIAAPSANRSGRISPTTAPHVRDELGEAIPLIIDGGACDVGIESTVVDCTDDAPVILRSGAITKEMVETVTGDKWHVANGAPVTFHLSPVTLSSPGQLASHYAPSKPLRLNAISVANDEALLAFGPSELRGAAHHLNLSATGNLIEAAANLFAHLRALDATSARAIAAMPIPNDGIGEAINDRLTRAAAPR